MKITTNHCLDRIRFNRSHPTVPLELTKGEDDDPEPFWLANSHDSPEQLVEQEETRRWIMQAIQKLEPAYRLPLVLIDVEGLNYNEVTEALHVPLGTMKSRLARARRKLRQSLGGWYIERNSKP